MTSVLVLFNGGYYSDASGDLLGWKLVDALGHTPSSIELTIAVGQLDGLSMLRNGLTTRFATMVVHDIPNGRGSLGRQIFITDLRLNMDAAYGKPLLTARGRTVGEVSAFQARLLGQLGNALSTDYGTALEAAYGDAVGLRVWMIQQIRAAPDLGAVQSFLDDIGFRVYWPATRSANAAGAFLMVPWYDPEAPLSASDVDLEPGLALSATDLTRPVGAWDDTPVRTKVLTPDINDDPEATYTLQVSGTGGNPEILIPEVFDTEPAAGVRLTAEQWKLRAGLTYTARCWCYPAIRAGTRWQPWSKALISETFYATKVTHEWNGSSAPTTSIEGYVI